MARRRGAVAVVRRLLNCGRLYDLLQLIAGERRFRSRLARHLAPFSTATLIDIGGGTGPPRRVPAGRYVCLDVDVEKLRRFRAKWPLGVAVEADATACPFLEGVFDGALCTKVVHHLNEAELEVMLGETARILKPGGALILADAIRSPRWIPRLLWRLDRGAFPRSAAEIQAALPRDYILTAWEQIRLGIFHDVVLGVARRTVPGNPRPVGDDPFLLEATTTGA